MRALLAATIVLLLGSALSGPESSGRLGGRAEAETSSGVPSLIEIESASHQAGRHAAADVANLPAEEMPHLDTGDLPFEPINPDIVARKDSLHDLCNSLFTSALDSGLPVQFLSNLIYQESGLRNDTVSRAGAQGIAQFMPETAKENGLHNPFDPHQAIPASAKLLQQLRSQFGNLGLAAAAYNAGPRRVIDWLASGHSLPRETLDYVLRVTGRSAEQWRTAPPAESALTFRQELPCRVLPAFASLEQSQAEQTQIEPPPLPPVSADDQKTKTAPQPKAETATEHPAAEHPAAEHHATSNRESLARAWAKALNIAREEPGKRNARRERRAERDDGKNDGGKNERRRKLADARESRTRPSHSRS